MSPSVPNLAATSFSRSDLQLLTPLLEALPDPLSPGLPNILKLTQGLCILLWNEGYAFSFF